MNSTPTKKLCLVVERIATPPPSYATPTKLSRVPDGVTPEKSGPERPKKSQEDKNIEATDSPVFKERGRGVTETLKKEVTRRSSPRLKRERPAEISESELEGESGSKGKKNVREHSEIQRDSVNNKRQKKMKSKAVKAIKYLGDSEEEEVVEKDQALLTASGTSGKALGLASPSKKPAASPLKQTTPEREGYLVKQSGLTFDKEKSASPVKKRKESSQGGVTTTHSSPATKKPVSSPVKPVSRHPPKPVTPASKPVSSLAKPKTTPSGPPKLSRGSSYRNYMNRGGPKAPGSKVVPEGEENCFEGLTFVLTGVLESLEREEAADIIKRFVY